MKRAVVLLSGGLDSALVLEMVREKMDEVWALFFDYGQRTKDKERECAHQLCKLYTTNFVELKLPLSEIGGSSLTDWNISVPEGEVGSLSSTYVPFRNGVFTAVAVSFAESHKIKEIYFGVKGLLLGYIDATPEYFEAWNHLLKIGTVSQIKIINPIMHYTKVHVVREIKEREIPVEYTWSCYGETKVACGICEPCITRRRAFLDAGFDDDEIPYKTTVEQFKKDIGYE